MNNQQVEIDFHKNKINELEKQIQMLNGQNHDLMNVLED